MIALLPTLLALGMPSLEARAEDAPAAPAAADAAAAPDEDPRLWMEEVEGARAMDWVKARNAETEGAYAEEPAFREMQERVRAALDSDARIPYPDEMGGMLYNFWRDGDHPQGVWRRTTWTSYRSESPEWEVIIDLDKLSADEGQRWVWHGARCLRPTYEHCMIELSPGGSDASVQREFNLDEKAFVADGFVLPEAKSEVSWIDEDTLWVGTDFGPDSLTDSGYARTARIWTRGTPLESAPVAFEGEKSDVWAGAWHDHTPGWERDFAGRAVTFFTDELYERIGEEWVKIDKPDHTQAKVIGRHIYFEPRKDWTVGDQTFKAGSLVMADYRKWMKGRKKPVALFTPEDNTSLAGWTATQSKIVLEILEDVRSKVVVLSPKKKGRDAAPVPGLPALGTVSVWAVDEHGSDDLWVQLTDYLTPSSLGLILPGQAPEIWKESPAFFDASNRTVTQHFATSKDGTKIPYFQVAPAEVPEGGLPTLLYGYGGFEVSLQPRYSAHAGIGWIEPGGVYVVANIRGGGEYGPRWHQAALKEKRHKAYEDFAAVGEDLVARGVTTPAQLGIMGGSNGGLLMGNMYTSYPEHWGAIVCAVPLLDMKRYTKLLAGASWAGEYGDPDDPAQWAYLQNYSPYHKLSASADHPPILFTTSTKDDRVHPGHARKMAELARSMGKNVAYYENIEGGHGGAANNGQQAFMRTLGYRFLWRQLTGDAPAPFAVEAEDAADAVSPEADAPAAE